MRATHRLLSVLRPHTPTAAVLSISEHSRERRSSYRELLQASRWQELAELCLEDLRSAHSGILALLGAARGLRALRAHDEQTARELDRIIAALEGARKAAGGAANVDAKTIRKLRKLRDEPPSSKDHGKYVLDAAHSFLRLQSAALQLLVEADLSHCLLAGKSEPARQLEGAFWRDPRSQDLARMVARFRLALSRLQRSVYLSAVGERASLLSRLDELSGWVARNLRSLSSVQLAISLLLEHADGPRDSPEYLRLSSLAVDAGLLIREAVASHLASLVSVLALRGIHLHQDTEDVLSKAYLAPFHGRLEIGKRTSLRRLGRLPDGMLVRLEGVLTSAELVPGRGGEGGYFLGRLAAFSGGGSIPVVAPHDLRGHGLRQGCRVRLSGVFRKEGSPLHGGKHLEVDRLKIREVYARDIWKAAFLDLATPYFNLWPGNYHVSFQIIPRESRGGELSKAPELPPTPLGACDREREKVAQAQENLVAAEADLIGATAAVTAAADFVGVACFVAGAPTWGTSCALALLALIAALIAKGSASRAVSKAQQALDQAQKALDDCLGRLGGGTGGSGGGSSGGSLDPGDSFLADISFDESLPEEESLPDSEDEDSVPPSVSVPPPEDIDVYV